MGRWTNSASPFCDAVLLKRFEPTIRPTDVFLSTFPKCGTTLIQNLLYQLREGGDPDVDCIYNHVPYLEYPVDGVSTEERLEQYALLKEPRIFKLHLRFDECPYSEAAKYITCSRDPRDAVVSLFFHQLHLNREYLKEREKLHHFPPRKIIEVFDEFVENWLERGEYWKFLNSWWPRRNHPNTLWSRFEDLLADLPTEVKRVVDFLKWNVSPDTIEKRILPLLDFEWMKQNERRFLMDNGKAFSGPFFRKGKIDRGESSLSNQLRVAILKAARENLPHECCDFVVGCM
jgi:Sulfotransferase domain